MFLAAGKVNKIDPQQFQLYKCMFRKLMTAVKNDNNVIFKSQIINISQLKDDKSKQDANQFNKIIIELKAKASDQSRPIITGRMLDDILKMILKSSSIHCQNIFQTKYSKFMNKATLKQILKQIELIKDKLVTLDEIRKKVKVDFYDQLIQEVENIVNMANKMEQYEKIIAIKSDSYDRLLNQLINEKTKVEYYERIIEQISQFPIHSKHRPLYLQNNGIDELLTPKINQQIDDLYLINNLIHETSNKLASYKDKSSYESTNIYAETLFTKNIKNPLEKVLNIVKHQLYSKKSTSPSQTIQSIALDEQMSAISANPSSQILQCSLFNVKESQKNQCSFNGDYQERQELKKAAEQKLKSLQQDIKKQKKQIMQRYIQYKAKDDEDHYENVKSLKLQHEEIILKLQQNNQKSIFQKQNIIRQLKQEIQALNTKLSQPQMQMSLFSSEQLKNLKNKLLNKQQPSAIQQNSHKSLQSSSQLIKNQNQNLKLELSSLKKEFSILQSQKKTNMQFIQNYIHFKKQQQHEQKSSQFQKQFKSFLQQQKQQMDNFILYSKSSSFKNSDKNQSGIMQKIEYQANKIIQKIQDFMKAINKRSSSSSSQSNRNNSSNNGLGLIELNVSQIRRLELSINCSVKQQRINEDKPSLHESNVQSDEVSKSL